MRTTYQGIYPVEFLSGLSYEHSRRRWETVYLSPKSCDVTFVAEESSKIVGFMICGDDRDNDPTYKGEVIGIYVLQSKQRQGIGKQLMLATVNEFRNRGFDSMIVWVLADNPARHFYEHLEGEHIQTRDTTVGGKRFQECGYGWKNLDTIFKNSMGDNARSNP